MSSEVRDLGLRIRRDIARRCPDQTNLIALELTTRIVLQEYLDTGALSHAMLVGLAAISLVYPSAGWEPEGDTRDQPESN